MSSSFTARTGRCERGRSEVVAGLRAAAASTARRWHRAVRAGRRGSSHRRGGWCWRAVGVEVGVPVGVAVGDGMESCDDGSGRRRTGGNGSRPRAEFEPACVSRQRARCWHEARERLCRLPPTRAGNQDGREGLGRASGSA